MSVDFYTEYVAAANLDDAIKCLADNLTDGDIEACKDEYINNPKSLSDSAMGEYLFEDEEFPERNPILFKDKLCNMIRDKIKFPCIFAYTGD